MKPTRTPFLCKKKVSYRADVSGYCKPRQEKGHHLTLSYLTSKGHRGELAGLEKLNNDISGTECVSTNRQSSLAHETDTAHQAFNHRRSNATTIEIPMPHWAEKAGPGPEISV